eukprot:403350210
MSKIVSTAGMLPFEVGQSGQNTLNSFNNGNNYEEAQDSIDSLKKQKSIKSPIVRSPYLKSKFHDQNSQDQEFKSHMLIQQLELIEEVSNQIVTQDYFQPKPKIQGNESEMQQLDQHQNEKEQKLQQQMKQRISAKTSYEQFKEKQRLIKNSNQRISLTEIRQIIQNQEIPSDTNLTESQRDRFVGHRQPYPQNQVLITEIDDYIYEDKIFVPRVKTGNFNHKIKNQTKSNQLQSSSSQDFRIRRTIDLEQQQFAIIPNHQNQVVTQNTQELSFSSTLQNNMNKIDILIKRPKSKLLSLDIDKQFIDFLTSDQQLSRPSTNQKNLRKPQSQEDMFKRLSQKNQQQLLQQLPQMQDIQFIEPRLNEYNYKDIAGVGGFPCRQRRTSNYAVSPKINPKLLSDMNPKSPFIQRLQNQRQLLVNSGFGNSKTDMLVASMHEEHSNLQQDMIKSQSVQQLHNNPKQKDLFRFKYNMAYNNLKNRVTKEALFKQQKEQQGDNRLRQNRNSVVLPQKQVITAQNRINFYKNQMHQQRLLIKSDHVIMPQEQKEQIPNQKVISKLPIKSIKMIKKDQSTSHLISARNSISKLNNLIKQSDQDIQTASNLQPSPINASYLKARIILQDSFDNLTNENINETRLISDRELQKQVYQHQKSHNAFKVSIFKSENKINQNDSQVY